MGDMPEREEPQSRDAGGEGSRLVNMSQLAVELGTTRQAIHAWRRAYDDFPQPRRQPGSTRDQWDLAEVRRYWDARELQPGRRTDLHDDEYPAGSPTHRTAPAAVAGAVPCSLN